jgi:hypothetical protein
MSNKSKVGRFMPARLSSELNYTFWVKVSEKQIRSPFFELQNIPLTKGYRRQRKNEFLALGENSDLNPALFIHHTGRCGSTLLSETFRVNPANLVINEPDFLGEIHRAHVDLSQLEYRSFLRAGINALSVSRTVSESRTIVKTSTASLLEFSDFQKAYPDTPYIFLQRHPFEVLASYLTLPAEFMTASPFWKKGKTLLDLKTQLKFIINLQVRAYNQFLSHIDSRALVLDYSDLSHGKILKLHRKLGFEMTPEMSKAMEKGLALYSKDSAHRKLFKGDKISVEVREILALEKSLIEKELLPLYEKVLKLRAKL